MFKSKSQARYMFALHPKMAKEFMEKTKNMSSLPEHIKKKKKPIIPQIKK